MAKKDSKVEIGLLMGSDSDWPLVKGAVEVFDKFGIKYEVKVMSAHRTPDLAAGYARGAARRGLKIIIAAAGGAAHLAGTLAAHTSLPVIGIPVKGGAFNGLDALLATVQMPAGIPVATVAVGSSGATNAALLAVQILALNRSGLASKLSRFKKDLAKKVEKGNARVQQELKK